MTKEALIEKTKFFLELMRSQFHDHFSENAVINMNIVGDNISFWVYENTPVKDGKGNVTIKESYAVNTFKTGNKDWYNFPCGEVKGTVDGDYM